MLLEVFKSLLMGSNEEENEEKLNSRLEIRLKREDKILIKQFANFRGITTSQLVRRATLKYINDVIKIED